MAGEVVSLRREANPPGKMAPNEFSFTQTMLFGLAVIQISSWHNPMKTPPAIEGPLKIAKLGILRVNILAKSL